LKVKIFDSKISSFEVLQNNCGPAYPDVRTIHRSAAKNDSVINLGSSQITELPHIFFSLPLQVACVAFEYRFKIWQHAFGQTVRRGLSEKKRGAIPNNAGVLFRFVHEMKPSDIVVYPSKRDRRAHLGRGGGESQL
jgi:hypothetical protein